MKFLKLALLTIVVSLSLNAETKSNSKQEYKNIEDKQYTSKVLHNIYKYVVLNNSKNALSDIKILQELIVARDEKKAKKYFSTLVSSWKKVQAFYILGDLDDEYLDTPRYIDIFHEGNEDIKVQLDLILNSKDKLSDLLYKNSNKSINALEYLLFTKDLKNNRVNQALQIVAKAIESHLEDIYSSYKKEEKNFYKDYKKANAMIINALIESSYKLKEWRVADIAGLTKKYKNNPDNSRAEYYISKNSAVAVKAILLTYKDIMDSPKFDDFGDYFKNVVKSKELKLVVKNINNSLALANKIENDDLTKVKKLYKSLKKVHIGFYIYLIDALKMNAKILDADGD